ncbi:MAG: CehA/McbA family metallohydrolase [Ardenticatenaceae bacterium]|nr:CehA/McbA family metallohydrolase [Ardenticatenaceae bacterium]HBY96078.1 hypothetical protein [Chloroflexota bacterium]
MPAQTITLEGTFRLEQEKTYAHLPFDVPDGATQIEVRYAYSNRIGSSPLLTGGNTIDLGVFDARGIEFLNAGFRGWSGSERDSFVISETAATPGYLAGALIRGRWHVLLGLYKVAAGGCDYRVEITITAETGHQSTHDLPAPVASLPASRVEPPLAAWLGGELHCHTWHSDGDGSPIDVVNLARECGLDFLAISDHNTISSQLELAGLRDPGLILIRGVEVTTFKGHFNVWGIGDWVDFRVQRPDDMAAAIRFAVEHGAVTSCSHPKPFGPPWDYEDVTGYDCIEVWNGPWQMLNQKSLDFWCNQLATGKRIPAVGGSDYHRRHQLEETPPRAPGTPTSWVHVVGPPNAAAVLQAIRQGHISLSDQPDGPFLELRAGAELAAMGGDVLLRPEDGQLAIRVHCRRCAGNTLRLLDQRGVRFERMLAEPEEVVTAEIPVSQSLYIRAELRDAAGDMKALTNPIHLDSAP